MGVIGTRATIGSGIYERLLKEARSEIQVFSQACPLLVPLVEEGWLKRPETKRIVRKYLFSLKMKQVDTLVLGCTHYPLLKPIIQAKMGRRVEVIDSSQEVALVGKGLSGKESGNCRKFNPRCRTGWTSFFCLRPDSEF